MEEWSIITWGILNIIPRIYPSMNHDNPCNFETKHFLDKINVALVSLLTKTNSLSAHSVVEVEFAGLFRQVFQEVSDLLSITEKWFDIRTDWSEFNNDLHHFQQKLNQFLEMHKKYSQQVNLNNRRFNFVYF